MRYTPIQLYPIFPAHSPPRPNWLRSNRESAGKYYAKTCYYSGSTGNEPRSQGIEPGTALLLANANTTKPLRRCNGLVVLAFANKSGVPRVLGWPCYTPIPLYPIFPAHSPPRPNRLRSLIEKALGSITPKLAIIVVARGMKPEARELNPGSHFC